MPTSCCHLYIHAVWRTWDSLPLVLPGIEAAIHAAIAEECRNLSCIPIAVNGTDNHIHLLVRLNATVSVAELMKQVKGSSSHLVTHVLCPGEFFKWQDSYGAFTVSPNSVKRVEEYVARQKEHHATGAVHDLWERCEKYPDEDASV